MDATKMFSTPPSMTLVTEQDLRDALNQPSDWFYDYNVKQSARCEWLIALIREMRAGKRALDLKPVETSTDGAITVTTINLGFDTVYNRDVVLEAQKRLGLPQDYNEGTPISHLVYTAQDWARIDEMREDGFVVATKEMLEDALKRKRKILTSGGNELTLRRFPDGSGIGGFRPRERARYYPVLGVPIKFL